MKKIIIFSVIILNGVFTPSLFGMFKNVARRIQLCKLQQRKCTSKKNENSNLSQIEPDARLKSPRDILNDIHVYWKKIDKTDSLQQVNNPEEYVKDINKAHNLLIDALFASHMCSQIFPIKSDNMLKNDLSLFQSLKSFFMKKNHEKDGNSHEIRLGNHHRFMNEWHAEQMDPYIKMPFHITYEEHAKSQRDIYMNMNGWDAEETARCKEELAKAIMNLRQHYTYGKAQLKNIKLKDKSNNKNNE